MTNRTRSVQDGPKAPAVTGFNEFGLHAELLRALDELEFTQPTPIQTDAIPPAMAGRDLLACATTGSGKTAAFLLPILNRLRSEPRRGTKALIITPTRELAAQIVDHFGGLAKHTKIRAAAVYGGVGMKPQEDALRRGVDIIVATPGRLLDHMQYDYARLADLEVLVLDEADRMLDMGFLPDIRRILAQLPKKKRQTLFFSATIPAPIAELSRELLDRPARINIERKAAPATGITQALYPVSAKLKADLLVDLLRRNTIGNAIVFCRTKHRANRLAEKVTKAGISTARIHGNRSQAQRTEALAGFKTGRYRVLVATDIVARGIDVEALEHVVNFDVPAAPDDYIHRVGRTARAEAIGDAYTLVSPEEEGDVRAIERAIGRRIERRTVSGFDYNARTQEVLEVPLAERIAAIRARKSEERARARAKQERENVPISLRSRAEPPRAQARMGNRSGARGRSR
ncbi:MAG: DEAD/DEAH box helicase [Gemmatimonadota bacterium]